MIEGSVVRHIPFVATVHTLVMGMAGKVAVANHEAYARVLGYGHRVCDVATGIAPDRTQLLRKYSAMIVLLRESSPHEMFIFVEDCVAFVEPLDAAAMLGAQDIWICEDGHRRGYGNGALIIVRGGSHGIARIEAILARCQNYSPESWAFSRWNQSELKDEYTIGHDTLVAGRYPNLLFPAFGHAMPRVQAWAVSFNPHVLPHSQDRLSNESVIRHITACLEGALIPFSASETEVLSPVGTLPREGRFSRVGIVLVVLHSQEDLAGVVEQNLRTYAEWHGYAFYRFETAICDGQSALSALLRQAARASPLHEQLFCVTADVLIQRLKTPLPGLLGTASGLVARSPWGEGGELGGIALRKDRIGLGLLNLACEQDGDAVEHQINAEIAAGSIKLADFYTFAPHTAFRDRSSFIVRYSGLPHNVTQLIMREDAASAIKQIEIIPKTETSSADLGWLRSNIFKKAVIIIIMVSIAASILAGLK